MFICSDLPNLESFVFRNSFSFDREKPFMYDINFHSRSFPKLKYLRFDENKFSFDASFFDKFLQNTCCLEVLYLRGLFIFSVNLSFFWCYLLCIGLTSVTFWDPCIQILEALDVGVYFPYCLKSIILKKPSFSAFRSHYSEYNNSYGNFLQLMEKIKKKYKHLNTVEYKLNPRGGIYIRNSESCILRSSQIELDVDIETFVSVEEIRLEEVRLNMVMLNKSYAFFFFSVVCIVCLFGGFFCCVCC